MSVEKWKEIQSRKCAPGYTHFDYRISLNQCWPYISDSNKVSHHGFYPFIHYEKKSRRIKEGKKADLKIRNIFYAAHLDGWIYKYYAFLLNEIYNQRVQDDGISSVAVAYRTDLGKNNIDFAHEAFRHIKNMSNCYVLVGDFTDFFDTLDHSYLKQSLCDLMKVKKLPADFYAVFKNVTRFSYCELEDLLALNGLENTIQGRKEFNKKSRALSSEAFRDNKTKLKLNPRGEIGVPQGSPISAVLANIYMLSFDKLIFEHVNSCGGFYMRYSDDFMIVLPDNGDSDYHNQYSWIKTTIDSIPKLNLQEKKTKLFYVCGTDIKSCTNQYIPAFENSKNAIDFLGFTFNGKEITIRDKTLSKYYHRLYRKAGTIARHNGFTSEGNRISCKNLYEKYSYKGSLAYQKRRAKRQGLDISQIKLKGNFLDYIERSQMIFNDEPINRGTKRHMQKIRKRLKNSQ